MRLLLVGLGWSVLFHFATCMAWGGYVGGRTIMEAGGDGVPDEVIRRRVDAEMTRYIGHVALACLGLGMLGSFTGVLPGSRGEVRSRRRDPWDPRPAPRRGVPAALVVSLAAGLVVAAVVGLAVSRPQLDSGKFESVRRGMSRAEVARVLGAPSGDYSGGGAPEVIYMESPSRETWVGPHHALTVFFDDADRVTDLQTCAVVR